MESMAQFTLPTSESIRAEKLGSFIAELNARGAYVHNVSGPHTMNISGLIVRYYVVTYTDVLTEGGAYEVCQTTTRESMGGKA